MKKEIVSDPNLVAYCGLYCGACGLYLRNGCSSCRITERMGWCKLRICCIDNEYTTCADCKDYDDPKECSKFNNFLAKFMSVVLRSNRPACIKQIKEMGLKGHADNMAANRRQTIKR